MQVGFRNKLGNALDNMGLVKGMGKSLREQSQAIKPLELEFSVDCIAGIRGNLFFGGLSDNIIFRTSDNVDVRKVNSTDYFAQWTFSFVKLTSVREYFKVIIKDPDSITSILYQSGSGQRAQISFPLGDSKMFLLKNLTVLNYSFQAPVKADAARMPTNSELLLIPKLLTFVITEGAIKGVLPSGLFNSTITTIILNGISQLSGLQSVPDLSSCTSISTLQFANCVNYLTGALPASIQSLTGNIFTVITLDWNITSIPDLDMLKVTTFSFLPRNTLKQYFKLPLNTTVRNYSSTNSGSQGYDSATLDLFIDYIYTNRLSYDNTASKTCTFTGQISNAAPGGTLQAPVGFVFGVSDGVPTSAKEQIYVLVNQTADGTGSGGAKKYKWTFTTA